MKKSKLALALTFIPAVLAAQSATASTTADAAAKVELPASYSAESQAKLNATFQAARDRKLPDRPIRDRIAEGQAKSASEAQVVVAAQRVEARLEMAQSAMVRAGRQPNDAEMIRAEAALARGATEAQIEAVARRTQPNQQIVVQLDALAGGPATNSAATINATVATPGVAASAGAGAAAAATATSATASATAGLGAVIRKPPML